MNSQKILVQIRRELKSKLDLKYKIGAKNYFKELIKLYGVRAFVAREIGRRYFALIKNKSKKEIFELAEELLKSGYQEEALIAFLWINRLNRQYIKSDFYIFERWLKRYISNWATCDDLCPHLIGDLIMKYPELLVKIKIWTKSKNRWLRRGAAVSLIIPARRGKYLKDIFDIADKLLLDNDDLVQKGYGWMLKAASRLNQKSVFDYVMKNKAKMPRVAFRYAIEKMPIELKKKAMER